MPTWGGVRCHENAASTSLCSCFPAIWMYFIDVLKAECLSADLIAIADAPFSASRVAKPWRVE